MIRSSLVRVSSTVVRASAAAAVALGAIAPAFAGASCPVRPTLLQQRVLAHAGSVEQLRQFAYISRGIWGLDTYSAADQIDKLRKAEAACRSAQAEPSAPAAEAPSPTVALTGR